MISGLSSMWAKWSRGNKIPELDALEDMERDMERSINMQIESMDVNMGEPSAEDSVGEFTIGLPFTETQSGW